MTKHCEDIVVSKTKTASVLKKNFLAAVEPKEEIQFDASQGSGNECGGWGEGAGDELVRCCNPTPAKSKNRRGTLIGFEDGEVCCRE